MTPPPRELYLPARAAEIKPAAIPPAKIQPLSPIETDGYRFEQGAGLIVSRNGRRLLRVPGEFFLPAPPAYGDPSPVNHPCGFASGSRHFVVLGERDPNQPLQGAWHIIQTRPRLRYIQRIKTIPDVRCPLLVLTGELPELTVDDSSLCGFDGDEDCELAFTVWYAFRGHFRPDYSLAYEAPREEYLDEITWKEDWYAVPDGRLAPQNYWAMVLNLIVGGQVDAANDFLEFTFPGDERERSRAVAAFLKRFQSSRHYRGILQLNRGRMVH